MKLLSVVIVSLFAFALTLGGMTLSYDSQQYVQAAQVWRETGIIPASYGSWTPLYPMLLGFSSDPISAARWLNVICYAISTWIALSFIQPQQPKAQLALVIALILSPALTLVHQLVWSEPLFITLTLTVLALAPSAGRRWLLLALVVALACVQRYTGILLIPIGVLALVLDRAAWYKIGGFVAISVFPISLWALRNLQLGYAALGARSEAQFTLYQSAQFGTLTLAGWILTFGIALWVCRKTTVRLNRNVLLLSALYAAGHWGMTIYSGATTGIDAPDNRLLSPIFIPLLLCTFAAAAYISKWNAQASAPMLAKKA